jgi:hypothetical protein
MCGYYNLTCEPSQQWEVTLRKDEVRDLDWKSGGGGARWFPWQRCGARVPESALLRACVVVYRCVWRSTRRRKYLRRN